jgi:hypothetical protein
MKIEKHEKTGMPFDKIWQGTILKKGDKFYMKASGGAAVNMGNGDITYPANDADGGWENCYIYPKASLSMR